MPPVRRQISMHASRLRRDATDVERTLSDVLRNRGLHGLKFRRQTTVGPYVVDFLCVEAKLVVELDGGQHEQARDQARTAFIEARGYEVLRFWNNEVITSLDGIIETIAIAANRRRPSSNPLTQTGEG